MTNISNQFHIIHTQPESQLAISRGYINTIVLLNGAPPEDSEYLQLAHIKLANRR